MLLKYLLELRARYLITIRLFITFNQRKVVAIVKNPGIFIVRIFYEVKRRMDGGYIFFGFSSNDFLSSSENTSFELQIK